MENITENKRKISYDDDAEFDYRCIDNLHVQSTGLNSTSAHKKPFSATQRLKAELGVSDTF